MPTTPRGLVYPDSTEHTRMWEHLENLADSVDTALGEVETWVVKTAAETVTGSAVLQNDDQLLAAIPAAGTYVFDSWLYAHSSANAGGDIQVAFSFPAATACYWSGVGPHNALASGSNENGEWSGLASPAASGANPIPFGLSVSPGVSIRLHGLLIATAAGTLRQLWAQQAASGSSTVRAGSHMRVRKIA